MDQISILNYDNIEMIEIMGDQNRTDVLNIAVGLSKVTIQCRIRSHNHTLLKTRITIRNLRLSHPSLGLRLPLLWNELERVQIGQMFNSACVTKLFATPPEITNFRYRAGKKKKQKNQNRINYKIKMSKNKNGNVIDTLNHCAPE